MKDRDNEEVTIGDRIKEARLKAKLSQTELADLIGVAQNTLSAYEAGRRIPTLKKMDELAKHLDVKTSWLRGEIEYTPSQKEFLTFIEQKKKIDIEELKSKNFKLVIDGEEATEEEIENAIRIIIGMREYKKRS